MRELMKLLDIPFHRKRKLEEGQLATIGNLHSRALPGSGKQEHLEHLLQQPAAKARRITGFMDKIFQLSSSAVSTSGRASAGASNPLANPNSSAATAVLITGLSTTRRQQHQQQQQHPDPAAISGAPTAPCIPASHDASYKLPGHDDQLHINNTFNKSFAGFISTMQCDQAAYTTVQHIRHYSDDLASDRAPQTMESAAPYLQSLHLQHEPKALWQHSSRLRRLYHAPGSPASGSLPIQQHTTKPSAVLSKSEEKDQQQADARSKARQHQAAALRQKRAKGFCTGLRSAEVQAALSRLAQIGFLPIGEATGASLQLTISAMFLLLERASASPAEMASPAFQLTALWLLESMSSQYRSSAAIVLCDYLYYAGDVEEPEIMLSEDEWLEQLLQLQPLLLQRANWHLLMEMDELMLVWEFFVPQGQESVRHDSSITVAFGGATQGIEASVAARKLGSRRRAAERKARKQEGMSTETQVQTALAQLHMQCGKQSDLMNLDDQHPLPQQTINRADITSTVGSSMSREVSGLQQDGLNGGYWQRPSRVV